MKIILVITGIFVAVVIGVAFLFVKKQEEATDNSMLTKYAANPLFRQGTVNGWDFQPGDPFVMQDGGKYKMWFGANEEARRITQVGYAESPDGITWTIHPEPVVRAGSQRTYDATVVETPTVVKDIDGTYHIWYGSVNKFGGDGDEAVYRISHAISRDGVQWTKNSDNPVLRPADLFANHWTSWGVLEPKVIKEGNEFRMWFVGLNAEAPEYKTVRYRLGYATSADGSRWIMREEPLLEFCTGELGSSRIYNSAFDVVKISDRYEFFYLGGDCPDVHAISRDGISWTKQDIEGKILAPGPAGSWDDGIVSSPSVLVDGQKLRMWYSGAHITFLSKFVMGVGLAEER